MLQKEMKGIKEKIGGEKISDASSTVIKLFTSNGQEETLKIETVRDWPTTITLTQQNKTRQIEIDSWTMGKQQLTLNSPSKDFDSSAPETHVLLKQLAKKIFTISQSNLLAGEEPMFTGPDGKSYPSMDMVRAAKAELNPKKEKPRR